METSFAVHRKIENSPAIAVHGQVFTKPEIVQLILDVAGYKSGTALSERRLLDPGCGNGAFLVEAARRLVSKASDYRGLRNCLLGVEKDANLAEECRESLRSELAKAGVPKRQANDLVKSWVLTADFLDFQPEQPFDFVVGNPPYVRQEAIPSEVLLKLRAEMNCFYDRADLYMAFIEKGLAFLGEQGTLAFICPNRFTRNRYGTKLRALITDEYALETIIDLPETSPFIPEVLAYPGIYVVRQGRTKSVKHVFLKDVSEKECKAVSTHLNGKPSQRNGHTFVGHTYESWFKGEQQWSIESPEHLAILRRLEEKGIAIGDPTSGCKVGIGVATGADRVFIVRPDEVEIEKKLMIPLVTTKDIVTGKVKWAGNYLINPFEADGTPIDLSRYPKAKKYFTQHREILMGRNVAKRKGARCWYRTIDRVHAEWLDVPMLLFPDIKANNETIALKTERLYPHHNLYFITSTSWDLRALRTIMRSSIAKFFVWMYGVKMRSGFFRFQAQYLRKISIPQVESVKPAQMKQLVKANGKASREEIDELVRTVYGLPKRELAAIRKVMD